MTAPPAYRPDYYTPNYYAPAPLPPVRLPEPQRFPEPPPRRCWAGRLLAGLLTALLSAGLGGVAGGYLVLRSGGSGQLGAARAAGGAGAGTSAVPNSLVGAVAKVMPGVVSIQVSGRDENATGSGFVIDNAQHVVTNAHVVQAAGSVTVIGSDGRERAARVVGRNARTDIAVLLISSSARCRPVTLGRSADVRVGEQVLAVGSPLGLAGTVTAGIVSAVNREVQLADGGQQSAVQTDASINPGNSGGPLVNANGKVIGVNTAIASIQGGGSIGIGFAIPIDRAAQTARQLIRTG
jgi:putative serine protease PepD